MSQEREDAALRQCAEPGQRDNAWLAERLRLLWDMHFADVPVGYPITTQFGTRANLYRRPAAEPSKRFKFSALQILPLHQLQWNVPKEPACR